MQSSSIIKFASSATFLFSLSSLFLQHMLLDINQNYFTLFFKIFIIITMLEMTMSITTSWLALCRIALSRISYLIGIMLTFITTIYLFRDDDAEVTQFERLVDHFIFVYTTKNMMEKVTLVVVVCCLAISMVIRVILLYISVQRTTSLCFKKTLLRLYQLSLVLQEAERALQDSDNQVNKVIHN
eukprot:gnl/Chilomastix_caulleri/2269.p1 GENE.gnl/Chilomastix_caulleri/2269~~gnl/Chilomastix_caulleri/2269.p1  ORF type:complete len:184 (+),score=20.62 gnl/Chilomastix_caulleri/2269:88-639(+)